MISCISNLHGMFESEYYTVLREIIETNGDVEIKLLPRGRALSSEDLETLVQLVTDKKKYRNLSQYAINEICPDVNQILSRVFMRECASTENLTSAVERHEIPQICVGRVQNLAQRLFFVLILPQERAVYGVKQRHIQSIGVFDHECKKIGYIEWDKTVYGFHILKIDVDENYRKQKISSALMTLALRYFEDKKGIDKRYKVTLTACSEDPLFPQKKLVEFYQKFGFNSVQSSLKICFVHEMELHHPHALLSGSYLN